MSFPIVHKQFLWDVPLNELLDFNSYQVKLFIQDCKTPKDITDKIIKVIQYPFYLGQPVDDTKLNRCHGKWCKTVKEDSWLYSSWTLATKLDDCEGSSMACVSSLRAFNVKPEDVYEIFGYVTDLNNNVLGGHGWLVCRDKSFGTDKFVLIESTLDIPPTKYPEVGSTLDDLKKPYKLNKVIYHPEYIWNDKYFIRVEELQLYGMRGRTYFDLRRRDKETYRKYQAISEAYGIMAKPLKKRGLLSRFRWRK